MAREYTPEELGLAPAKAQKEYTPQELGLAPKKEYTAQELGLGGPQPDELGRYKANSEPDQAPQETKTHNPFKGFASRVADVVGNTVEGIARTAEAVGDKLETAMPLTDLTPEQIKNENQLQPLFDFSKNLKDWSKDVGYAPSTTLGELPGKPLLLVPFIAERIISSSPDMVAAAGATVPYIVSRTNEILNDRLKNDNKSWEESTVADIAASASAAVFETYMEKFATKHLLPGGSHFTGSAAKKIGKETALQAGTEAVEEGIGYLGGAAGTNAGIDPSQMAQQMIEGAIVGGGLGAGVQGGKEYVSRPRVNDGTSEPSIPSTGLEGETTGGVGRIDKEGLDVSGKRTRIVNGREEGVHNQLEDINAQINTLQEQRKEITDPNDPIINHIDQEIESLTQAKKDVDKPAPIPKAGDRVVLNYDTEAGTKQKDAIVGAPIYIDAQGNQVEKNQFNKFPKGTQNPQLMVPLTFTFDGKPVETMMSPTELSSRTTEIIEPGPKEKAYNAPAQEGFNFESADENTQRAISNEPTEFGLTAPEGKVDVSKPLEQLETPDYETSKMMLVDTGAKPTARVASFIRSLVPNTKSETEAKAYGAELESIVNEIEEFHQDAQGQERTNRLRWLNRFFDAFSIAPIDKQSDMSRIPELIKNRTPQEQEAMLSAATQLPKLNTARGLDKFRDMLTEHMMDYTEAKLGRSKQNAVLPFDADTGTDLVPTQDQEILSKLTKDSKDPKERSAYNYFSSYADYFSPYVMAMRSAAYDLGASTAVKQGELYKGQNRETAKLFRDWVAQNLGAHTLARFDATVEEFRKQNDRSSKLDKEAQEIEDNGPVDKRSPILQSLFRAPSGKTGKALPIRAAKALSRGLTQFINPKRFDVMHPAIQEKINQNDLQGALKLISNAKYGSVFQQNLAKRLSELNLGTTVMFDAQGLYAQKLIDRNTAVERLELTSFLKTAYPEVFKKHFANLTDIKATFDAISQLREGKLGIDAEGLKAYVGQIETMYEQYQAGVAILNASGTYLPYLDTITLNKRRGGNSLFSFLHEVSHAASHWALNPDNYDKLTDTQKKAVNDLKEMHRIVKGLNGGFYGELNIDEFVAEAFSNPQFQAFLKSIPYESAKEHLLTPIPAKKKVVKPKQGQLFEETVEEAKPAQRTLWDRFTRFIADLIGMNNMLGYTLANANVILQAPPALSTEAYSLNAQGKSGSYALDETFRTAPTHKATTLGAVFSGRPSWDQVKHKMPEFLAGLKESKRKYLLNGLTLRMLQDIVGNKLPQLKQFIEETEKMATMRDAILNDVGKIAKVWTKWQKANPEKANILNALMIDSSRLFIDPEHNKTDPKLNKAWIEIGPEGQAIYKQARDFFEARKKAFDKSTLDNIKKHLIGKGLTEAEAKAHPDYVGMQKRQAKHTITPYFPFRRNGEFWYQVTSAGGKLEEFVQFESEKERTEAMKERQAELDNQGSNSTMSQGNSIRQAVSTNLQSLEFLETIKKMIGAGQGAGNAKLKENLIASTEELFLSILPDQSVRKLFNRKGTPGMNPDMLRGFTATGFRMAYQHARYEHTNKLFRTLEEAEGRLKGMEPKEAGQLRDYINQFYKNLDKILNPPNTDPIVGKISDISFLWYLSGPASAFVNMLGVPAVSFPVVSARFGAAKTAAKMLVEYPKKFLTAGLTGPDGKVAFPSLENNLNQLSKVQQEAFKALHPLFNITLTHDVAGLSSVPSMKYTGTWKKFMGVATALFHGAEKFNREVVGMSIFDMSYERNLKNGMTQARAFDKAVSEAKELTYKSMGDYATENKPLILQNQYAKVIGQFKQFPLTMTYLITRSGIEGFSSNYKKGDTKASLTQEMNALQATKPSPETRRNIEALQKRINARHDTAIDINAERTLDGLPDLTGDALDKAVTEQMVAFKKEGMDRLMGTMAMTFLFSGVTGMFGWSAFSSLMEVMHYMWADDDDEDKPFDFDNWFKNWMNETFGGFLGDSISRGIASQATGLNVADRMSLDGMWYRDSKNSPDNQSALQAFIVNLLGPTAALGVSAAHSVDLLNQGHLERAVETALPAFARNFLKANRLGNEGAISLSGDELIPDFSASELAGQALGFSPERLAQKQKANIETKGMEQEILKKHQDLLNAYFMAFDTADADMQERILNKILKFNNANPGSSITAKSLRESIKRRYKQRALAEGTGGAHINKKLIGQLGEMNRYGEE